MALSRSWYQIEGRGRHIITFFHAAFGYRIVIILSVIIIAILVFCLDVSLAKEDVALCGTLVSMMGASVCGSHVRG
jgi:nitrate/nitrite transporter NarK